MSDSFTGTLQPFAFDFAPRGWALCTGSLLPIAQYGALYSLLTTTWGGDGRATFGIPDARGRAVLGAGTSQLTGVIYRLGQYGGHESVTLKEPNAPAHVHGLQASTDYADYFAPGGDKVLGRSAGLDGEGGDVFVNIYGPRSDKMKPIEGVGAVIGGSQPVSVLQPALTTNLCICTNGAHPLQQ